MLITANLPRDIPQHERRSGEGTAGLGGSGDGAGPGGCVDGAGPEGLVGASSRRTRPPRRPSSTTLRSVSRAREGARAAGSEEDEAATAAVHDCAFAASRSHCEVRTRASTSTSTASATSLVPTQSCNDGRPTTPRCDYVRHGSPSVHAVVGEFPWESFLFH